MKRTIITGIMSLGLVFTLSAGSFADKAASSVSHGDTTWVNNTYRGGAEEARLGQLAETKASNASVKAFGKHMATDHTAANKELKELADKKGIKIDTTDKKADADYKKLSGLSGAAFDKQYISMMVDGHKKVAASFQKESKSGSDPNIRAWAGKTLPTIQHHLMMAESEQKTVGK